MNMLYFSETKTIKYEGARDFAMKKDPLKESKNETNETFWPY